MSIFKSVVRGIQCYAGQVIGYGYEEQINRLQLYFLKYVLRLPNVTPTYAVFLETKEEPTHLYMLKLHMNFVFKTLFVYENNRLPHVLSLKIIEKKTFWYKEWCDKSETTLVRWGEVPLDRDRWKFCITSALQNCSIKYNQKNIEKKFSTHCLVLHLLNTPQ